jgi:hypothetical protein
MVAMPSGVGTQGGVTLIATDLRQSDQRDDPDPARKSAIQLMT